MTKFRSLIILLLMSAVFIAPLKLPTCPKQLVHSPSIFSFTVLPCTAQQVMNNNCFSSSYLIQDEFHLTSQWLIQMFIGMLSFLLIVSKYNSPLDEIYRPPI